MKKIIKGTQLLSVLFLALVYLGCDEDDVVLPQVDAQFTQTINQDTGVVQFINTSTNADNYSWDFGDGTTSTETNPVKVYASGSYIVELESNNNAGASDMFQDTLVITIPEVIAFPISFDNALVAYDATVFNGAAFQIVENPDVSGANPDVSNVGEIVNSGAAFEGFFFELGAPINLSTDNTVKIVFWSTTPTDVLLKLENGTASDVEVSVSHSGNGWEDMYFTFNTEASYSTTTFFVDGPGTTAGTFYIDNISQVNSEDVPCIETELEFPINFDCNGIDYASKIVGNVNFTVIDNPELSGVNEVDSKVGEITNVGAAFENSFFNLDVPIDFSSDNGVSLKLYSTQELPVLLKFEDGTEANTEDSQMHMGTGWEELSFTLNSSGSYNDMVLFIDGPGTTAGTFYVDDFLQTTPTVVDDTGFVEACDGGTLVNDFETADDTIFSNFGGGVGTIEDNSVTNINMSSKKARYVKNNGEVFAGITIALDGAIALEGGVFSIDVKSQAVRQLLFKLEGLNIEKILPTTGAGWETLTYDFGDVAGSTGDVTGITLIMDNGTAGDGTAIWTIDFDNIRLCSNGDDNGGGALVACDGGALINDYEAADNAIFSNFGGGVATIEDNADTSVNTSLKVGQYVKNPGEVFGGTTIAIATNIAFDGGVFSLDVKSQAVRQLLFKLEGLNVEKILPTAGTGWETLTYDFSSVAGSVGDVTAITLIMDNGIQGDGSADWTIDFDNMRLCSAGGNDNGGGGCTTGEVAATALPLNFEGCETFPQNLNFGGGLTSGLADNPNPSGSNTSDFVLMVDKPSGSDFFAGVQNNFANNFDLSNSSHEFKMKIYSTKPNAIFRFEVAQDDPGVGNPSAQFVTVTDANVWTEVSFTFSEMPAPTSYFRLVIKPDNDQSDSPITAGGTYYFDDIELIE